MTNTGPACEGGSRERGGRGEGTGEAGPGAVLAPLARQSPGCRERSARGPGPGHRTLYRTRPSLELGQLPTLDSAPDTAPHRAGHYNGHYFPAPDIAPSFPLGSGRFFLRPPPSGAQTRSPPLALAHRPWDPSARPCPLPGVPCFPSPPAASSFPGFGSEHLQPYDPLQLGRRLPALPSPGCSPGCLSPGDCGGSSAAVEASLFCTATTGTASLAGTETRTRTRRPLNYGPQVQRAAGG